MRIAIFELARIQVELDKSSLVGIDWGDRFYTKLQTYIWLFSKSYNIDENFCKSDI